MPVSLDIILPCYNPNDRWHHELLNFHETIKELYTVNYIVVNDGSVYGTISAQVEFLQKNNVSLDFISYDKNMGKGFALRRGVSVAMNEYMVYTDIDFPFTNKSAIDLIHLLVKNDHDVVAGFRDESYYRNKMSGFRRLLSKAFRTFIKNVLKLPVTDTQCGLKGFNRKGREKFLQTRINRYLFDFEFVYNCCKDKEIRIGTVAVNLKQDVVFSKMKIKILLQESVNLFYILFIRKN